MPNINKPSDINKVWSNAGDNLSPSDAKINGGWLTEIPPRQWFNWLDNKQDQAIAHINQHGIAVWDSVTEYQASTSYVQGSNGKLYVAVQTNTNQNPVTDVTEVYWADIFKPGFVVFNTPGMSSWTPPPILRLGIKRVEVEVIAGGGGGGSNANSGSGGGGGGWARKQIDLTGVTSVSVTVGAGGAGATAGGGTPAQNGGSSSFGAFCSATGGDGATGSSGQDRGVGGTASGGDINDTLGPGYQRCDGGAGAQVSGKGGGPGGGASVEGGAITGLPAAGFGCGGSGGTGGAAGGAGKNGLIIIRW